MKFKLLLAGFCVVAVAMLSSCAKSKTAMGIMVVEGGEAKNLTVHIDKDGMVSSAWAPGSVVLFRTDDTLKAEDAVKVPVGEKGKAGEAYVVTDDYKLLKIGVFDVKTTNEELVKRFSTYR